MRFTTLVEQVEHQQIPDGMGGWIDGVEKRVSYYGNFVELDKLTVKKEYGIEIEEPAKLFVRNELSMDLPLLINQKTYTIQSALLQHNIKVYVLGVE